ncbi:MAG: helix-turn-helix domain-containing protein [Nitrospirae bacterium]|nr:helix-turn-helix domain-containing protein [Nitrospirota bacterium]
MNILTVRDVAEFLKVKEKTLYQWAELGQIPHIKLNGALRFELGDIMKWIDSCKKQALECYYRVKTQAGSPKKGGL